jgi:hypothetical protein
MSDLDYDVDLERECPHCKGEIHRKDCGNFCDDGSFDGYEEDPLWYSPGDTYPCSVCRGYGYFYWCSACGADLRTFDWKKYDERQELLKNAPSPLFSNGGVNV